MTICVAFLFAILPNICAQESIASPLKQIKSGVLPQDVKCNEGFVLIIKSEDGEPSCVKSTSVTRLESHGWITLEEFASMNHLTSPQDKSNLSIQKQNDTKQATVNQNPTDIISNQTIKNTTISIQNHISMPENQPLTVVSNVINPNMQVINLVTPNQTIPINAIVTSSKPGSIKIVSVGLSSYPLKVGDTPSFSLTWKNTSSETFRTLEGPCSSISLLGVTITPEDHVITSAPDHERSCGTESDAVNPNQTALNYAYANPPNNRLMNTAGGPVSFGVQYYEITKSGILNVTMNLYVGYDNGSYALTDTVKFNVNATQ